ncbi:hypothetical protein MPSEU_000728100 [Mayamaea pseudoterrestris]|nr:hypothetical protein MPSEU_000727600 [Mayamaea pseudoterrestris]GKY97699.1 hypothetical protein MPSEU_000728100 [Mayamaea pseudoterrestris]
MMKQSTSTTIMTLLYPLPTIIQETYSYSEEEEEDGPFADSCDVLSVGSFIGETFEEEQEHLQVPQVLVTSNRRPPIRHVRTYSAETSFPTLYPGTPLDVIQVQDDDADLGVAIAVKTTVSGQQQHWGTLMTAMNETIFSSHCTTISDATTFSSSLMVELPKSVSTDNLMDETDLPPQEIQWTTPSSPVSVNENDGLLHNICFSYKPTDDDSAAKMLQLVQEILQKDPQSLMRKHVVHSTKSVYHPQTQGKVDRHIKAPYQYPLHMALANKSVPAPLIQVLLEAALKLAKAGWTNPLMLLDGHQLETPLMVLLKHQPQQVKLMDELILLAPASVALQDRRGSTALHLAVRHGASLVAIRQLVTVDPTSCLVENRLQQTPLTLAQRNAAIDTGVLNFLSTKTHGNNGRLW